MKRAFTVIEMLIAMSIILVLISILLPAVRHAREEAAKVVAMQAQKDADMNRVPNLMADAQVLENEINAAMSAGKISQEVRDQYIACIGDTRTQLMNVAVNYYQRRALIRMYPYVIGGIVLSNTSQPAENLVNSNIWADANLGLRTLKLQMDVFGVAPPVYPVNPWGYFQDNLWELYNDVKDPYAELSGLALMGAPYGLPGFQDDYVAISALLGRVYNARSPWLSSHYR